MHQFDFLTVKISFIIKALTFLKMIFYWFIWFSHMTSKSYH